MSNDFTESELHQLLDWATHRQECYGDCNDPELMAKLEKMIKECREQESISTRKVSIDTDSYNEKRYGKPWIAKATFENNKMVYSFGDWVGTHGFKGMLILDNVAVGDIIARGQKDNRGNNNEIIYYIAEEEDFKKVSKLEAFNHWSSHAKT